MKNIDNAGTELRLGQVVCYNLSGEIALGQISAIKTRVSGIDRQYTDYTFFVKRIYPKGKRFGWPDVSKITSSKNLMVVFESMEEGTVFHFPVNYKEKPQLTVSSFHIGDPLE